MFYFEVPTLTLLLIKNWKSVQHDIILNSDFNAC